MLDVGVSAWQAWLPGRQIGDLANVYGFSANYFTAFDRNASG